MLIFAYEIQTNTKMKMKKSIISFALMLFAHIYPSGGHRWGFRNTAQGFRYHVQMLDDLTTWLQHF